MNKRISDFVNLYFTEIPYSEEIKFARERIITALCDEYETLIFNNSLPEEAFEIIVNRYGKFADMAKLAGYTEEEFSVWKSDGNTVSLAKIKKEIQSQRRKIYAVSVLGVIGIIEIYWLIYNLITTPLLSLFTFAVMGLVAGAAFFILRKFIRTEKARYCKYDAAAYEYLAKMSDKYVKRRLNGIALSAIFILIFAVVALSAVLDSHTKPYEMTEVLFSNILLLEIPVFICIKNRLCFDLFCRRINLPEKRRFYIHFTGVTVFSAIYCAVTGLIVLLIKNRVNYYVNILIIAGILFAALYFAYIAVFRSKITVKNVTLNRRRVAVVTAVAVALSGFTLLNRETWYTQPYINSVAVVEHNRHEIDYDEESGVYTITSSTDDFKILHLTDIHLGGSLFSYRKDIKALTAVYAEIEYTKPDFVIVTGDLCFPLGIMSLSLNNSAPVYQFAAFMRNVGIPWAFTYGNHDTEALATVSKKDLNEIYKQLSYKTSGNLLYPYTQPDITGRNNQLIQLKRPDGSLNTALFLIDSNAYTGNGINDYDYIHSDQVEWYAENVRSLNNREGGVVPSMAFFHIPLQQYRTAYELYLEGSEEVKYFFGENNEGEVCCSDYPSELFDKMVELGSTSAVFCGHDHYNNMSLEYRGIRLTYGMSIDYLAMPGIENKNEQRGAELITVHSDGAWDIEQIPLSTIVK